MHIVPLLQLPRALSPPPLLLPLPLTLSFSLSLSLNRERTGIATGRPPLRVVNLARMPQNLPAQYCCCCYLLLNWLFFDFAVSFNISLVRLSRNAKELIYVELSFLSVKWNRRAKHEPHTRTLMWIGTLHAHVNIYVHWVFQLRSTWCLSYTLFTMGTTCWCL